MKILVFLMVFIAIIGMTGIGMACVNDYNPTEEQKCKLNCFVTWWDSIYPCHSVPSCTININSNYVDCYNNCENPVEPDPEPEVVEEHSGLPHLYMLGLRFGTEQARIDLGLNNYKLQELGMWSNHPLFLKGYGISYDKTMNMIE